MRKESKTVTFISVVTVILLFSLAVVAFRMLISSDNDSTKLVDSTETNTQGASMSNPIAISKKDTSALSGSEFVDKYKGKWVSFDGFILGTTKQRGDLVNSVGIVLGDSPNDISFKDMSIMKLPATKYTLDESLQGFTEINNSPAETSSFPRVNVTAKVERFDTDTETIYLSGTNTSAQPPSIKLLK